MNAAAALAPVIVPQHALDRLEETPEVLVSAVVDCVNELMHRGLFQAHEIPRHALQVYHADYYLAQVNNGGHAQFVGNSLALRRATWENARAGLVAMGAERQLELFDRMETWVDSNAEAASRQTGFSGGVAEELAALDSPFYAAEREDPMAPRAARWIASWSDLLPLPAEAYRAHIAALPEKNSNYGKRRDLASLRALARQLHDPFSMAITVGVGMVKPDTALVGLGAGAHFEVEGRNPMLWGVRTVTGTFYAELTPAGCAVFEGAERPIVDPGHDQDGTFRQLLAKEGFGSPTQTYRAPSKRVAFASRRQIEQARGFAEGSFAAAAIHLLAKRAELPSHEIMATPFPFEDTGVEGATMQWKLVFVDSNRRSQLARVETGLKFAQITASDSGATGTRVTAAEIEDHWRRLTDGS